MPQKPPTFQSKSRGGKGSSAPRSGGARGGFSKRSEGDSRDPVRGGDKPRGSFGPKKFGDKPRSATGDRKYGDRPAGERSYSDKPRGKFGDRPSGERSFGDKPRGKFGDRPSGERSFGDKKFGDKPRGKFGDRPSGERSFGDKKFGDKPRGKFGDRPSGERSFGDKKFGDKPRGKFGDRPSGERSFGDKKFGDKPRGKFGDRPSGERSFGDKKFGDKPRGKFGDRPSGERSFGDKKFGDKPRGKFGDRPSGERSFGDKKFGDRKFSDRKPARFEERPYTPASDETRQKLKSARANYGSPSPAYLYGVHAVTQALLNADRVHKRLLVTEKSQAGIEKTIKKAGKDGLTMPPITLVEQEDIDRLLSKDAVHQDLLLDSEQLEEVFLQDILLHAEKDSCIVVLDQVTDPHNVGAILRSAAAFGAIAVVAQKLHAPEITGVLAKSASGAVEHVPIVREVNLSRSLELLKDAGFTCIGLSERGESTLAGCKPKGKIAIVLGAEGDGLRRLVAENCDMLARLPTSGEIASLNVSNAAAIALYELSRLKD